MRGKAVLGWMGCVLLTWSLACAGAQPPAAHVRRNVSYGPSRDNSLDVFVPAAQARSAGKPLPILLFAPPESARGARHDNVALWAAHHRMIGIVMHRRDDTAPPWERGPQDMAAVLAWLQANAGTLGGDPRRVIALGADLGGTQLMNYLAHHEYWCCRGPAVLAAALIGAPVNLTAPVSEAKRPLQGIGGAATTDPTHSDLTGLDNLYLPVFVGSPRKATDPQRRGAVQLQQELCRRGRCPTLRFFGQSDDAAVLSSFDTSDDSASRMLLGWIDTLH